MRLRRDIPSMRRKVTALNDCTAGENSAWVLEMFWTIVGALAFFFIGLPIIFALVTNRIFWNFVLIVLMFSVLIWAFYTRFKTAS